VEVAVKNFIEKYPLQSGIKITTISEFSSLFGFGSSSASTVCTIKALSVLLGLNLSQKEIFDLSFKTVLDIQKKGSGFDVAAAVFGKTLYFVTGGRVIEPLPIFTLPLIVGYSGVKADTVTLINKVKESFTGKEQRLDEIYDGIKKLVEEAKGALVKSDWVNFGGLMNKNQQYLNELGVSIDRLNEMINASLSAGAYGAKLSGAGGGDCMIAVCPKDKEEAVRAGIAKAGGEVISVKTNAEGVRVE
jgi:mevalonate kinase